MKLTKETLKRIIKEELDTVLREVRIDNRDLRDLGMSQQHIDKIHNAIETGREEDMNQAQSLIDTFAEMMGETGYEYYVRNYVPSREVGDLEKLGNQANDMLDPNARFPGERTLKPGYTMDDMKALEDKAFAMAAEKTKRPGHNEWEYDEKFADPLYDKPSALNTQKRRFIDNSLRTYMKDFYSQFPHSPYDPFAGDNK